LAVTRPPIEHALYLTGVARLSRLSDSGGKSAAAALRTNSARDRQLVLAKVDLI
jgi:hypothetical protein